MRVLLSRGSCGNTEGYWGEVMITKELQAIIEEVQAVITSKGLTA
jgi:hypothetical protein